MKFNVPSKALYAFVSAVGKVINSKNAMTILNNFLFSLEGDKLQVVACDMENTLVGRIDVMGAEGSGKFCIDASRLVEMLKEIPDQGILFEIDDDNLAVVIDYSSGTFNIMGVNGDEYPYDPTKLGDGNALVAEFDIPASGALRGLETTLFAVAHDDLRPTMNGVYWDIKPDCITFVATDTKQLVKFVDHDMQPGVETSFVLPTKPSTVMKNVFERDGDLHVQLYEKCVVFESTDFTFTCTHIKGRYPDYNRVIPQSTAYTVTVDAEEFVSALKRVALFSGGQGLVKFKITPDEIKMRADDAGSCGNAFDRVNCEFTGERLLIGFGFKFLIEMFSQLKSAEGIIKVIDQSRPCLVVPSENAKGTELTMLLMPMSVTDFPDE